MHQRKQMRTITALLAAFLGAAFTLSSCATIASAPLSTPYATTCAPTLAPTATPQPEPTYAPYAFTADYHKSAPIIEKLLGPDVVNAAFSVVDAFLAHKTSVTLSTASPLRVGFGTWLGYALNCICPPFMALTSYNEISSMNMEKKTISWEYAVSEADFPGLIAAFEAATASYMSVLRQGDSDVMRAMLLYNALTKDATYDYAANDDSTITQEERAFRTSGYYALTQHSGICYSYSEAYTFLCLQAGLDCAMVSSMEGEGAHSWNMLCVGGKYYYCDPTWDIGGKFNYFGITAQDRSAWAGSFREESCYMLNTHISDTYAVDDTRFEALHDTSDTSVPELTPERGAMTLTISRASGDITIACK